jgi:hypothetical protein
MRELLGRHRLAGEGRLVDEQVLGLEQPQVRRDHVAGRQLHDVAGNQRLDRDLRECTGRGSGAPLYGGRSPHHGSQAGRRLVRAVLLDESGRDRQDDHDSDDDGCSDVAQEIGDRCQGQQKRVQWVLGAAPQLLEGRRLPFPRDQVGSVDFKPPRGLFRR